MVFQNPQRGGLSWSARGLRFVAGCDTDDNNILQVFNMFLKKIFTCYRVEVWKKFFPRTDCSKTKLADNTQDRDNNVISFDKPRI